MTAATPLDVSPETSDRSKPSASEAPDAEGQREEIANVVRRLRRTFRSGRTRAPEWREAQLDRLTALVQERRDALLGALHADLGKSSFEGYLAELALLLKDTEHAKKHFRAWMAPERVSTPLSLQPGTCRVQRDPLGVALVIAPWNYPVQLALEPLVGVIAAGNCAVLKPSEVSGETSKLLAELVPQYLDPDAIAVVEGGVPETTALLAERFDHIFFTGSTNVGRVVMAAAAKHLTPVTLELGGKSPTIVDSTADLDVAARRIVWAKFFNAGQTCVAPDYVLVDARVATPFVEKLRTTIQKFYGAQPQHSRDYGRIVSDRHFERLVGFLDQGEVVCGGDHDASTRFIAPTVLTGVSEHDRIMGEEIFGPVLPVLEVGSVVEAIDFVNERPKPLALYVFTRDEAVADRVLSETSSGGACVNDALTHLSVLDLPFGGVGESGMGAYHGKASFDTFTHHKSVLAKSNLLDIAVRYPPYSDTKAKIIEKLM
ncbi:MAG: aldehyde dehydrogenase family protein [Myxococcota bacterium]